MCYRKRVFNNPFNLGGGGVAAAAAVGVPNYNANPNLNNSFIKNGYNQLLFSINALNSKYNPHTQNNQYYCLFKEKTPSWNNLNQINKNVNALPLNSYTYPRKAESKPILRRWNSTHMINNPSNNIQTGNSNSIQEKANKIQHNETEIIKLKSQDYIDRVQKVEYKYLEPPKPKPGRLIINQEPDTYEPSPPPLVIVKSPQPTFTPPTAMFRQRPPKSPEHIDEVITIPGKKIQPPQKTIIVEKPQTNKNVKIVTEIWKAYPPKEINVELVKQSKVENTCLKENCLKKKLDDKEYLKIIEEIDWASVIIDQLKTRKLSRS